MFGNYNINQCWPQFRQEADNIVGKVRAAIAKTRSVPSLQSYGQALDRDLINHLELHRRSNTCPNVSQWGRHMYQSQTQALLSRASMLSQRVDQKKAEEQQARQEAASRRSQQEAEARRKRDADAQRRRQEEERRRKEEAQRRANASRQDEARKKAALAKAAANRKAAELAKLKAAKARAARPVPPPPKPKPKPKPAVFSEQGYLARYPDVARAVALWKAHGGKKGGFPSGLHHYRRHGFREGRWPKTPPPGLAGWIGFSGLAQFRSRRPGYLAGIVANWKNYGI